MIEQSFAASIGPSQMHVGLGQAEFSDYNMQFIAKSVSVIIAPRTRHSEFCCKVAVIFLALNALKCFIFCSNDCFSAENADFYFGRHCMQSGEFRIHNPKVGGSIPPPATNKINSLALPCSTKFSGACQTFARLFLKRSTFFTPSLAKNRARRGNSSDRRMNVIVAGKRSYLNWVQCSIAKGSI